MKTLTFTSPAALLTYTQQPYLSSIPHLTFVLVPWEFNVVNVRRPVRQHPCRLMYSPRPLLTGATATDGKFAN